MADNIYKRRFGDRKEGRQLHTLEAFYKFSPYIMKTRNDASNSMDGNVEVSETDRYLRQMRAEGYKGMGMLHLFIAAYIRTVSIMPGLNRFISGQKIFARRNIEVILIVKRSLTLEATETAIKVKFEMTDTVYDVYRKLNEAVDEIKADSGDNSTEKVANMLFKLPGLALKFAVWVLSIFDYFDLLPQSLLDASPFHGSLIITDLGSLGIPPVRHHLYNFGNLPVFFAFGAKRRSVELDKNGQIVERKYIDFTATLDERTVDGYYYASAFKYLKYYLINPQLLQQPPEKVEEDVF